MNAMHPALEWLLALLVVGGAVFALLGAVGFARFADFAKRLHGPTKVTTLGVGCVLVASLVYFAVTRGSLGLHELLVSAFLFLTAPVSAHLLVKAALKLDPTLRAEYERAERINRV